jgi:O-antigen ligase
MQKINKIIDYGLYLLVFILPWQTRWIIKAGELNGGGWEYGTLSLYATDMLLISLVLLFTMINFGFWILDFRLKIQNPKSKIQNFWWLIFGLIIFSLVSIFFAPNKSVAIFAYWRFLLGVGLFWLIIGVNYNKFKLIISLILGIFLQAALGIWQFLSQSAFGNKWLGLAQHNPHDLGVSVIETFSGVRWLRAYGGMDHPNMLGGLLVIGFLLLVYLLLENKKMNQELRIRNYKLEYFIFYFLFIVFMTALFFSFSRGAWLAAAIGLIVYFACALIKNDWLAQKKLLKIILLTGFLIFVFGSFYSDLIYARTSSANRLEARSNSERVESYKTGLKVFQKHWLFGTGIGNYTLAVHNEIDNAQPGYFYQPTHDVYLLVLSEIGVFGFLSFILFIIFLILNFKFEILNECLNLKIYKLSHFLKIKNLKFKIRKQLTTDKYLNFLNSSLIFALIILFAVDHWWWSLHFGVLLFWLVLGLVFIGNKSENTI